MLTFAIWAVGVYAGFRLAALTVELVATAFDVHASVGWLLVVGAVVGWILLLGMIF